MTQIRLPARAYARQLNDMRLDLIAWRQTYRQQAAQTTNVWFQGQCTLRAEQLEAIVAHLVDAEVGLYALPRVS